MKKLFACIAALATVASAWSKKEGSYTYKNRTVYWRCVFNQASDTVSKMPTLVDVPGDYQGTIQDLLNYEEPAIANWALKRGALGLAVVSQDTVSGGVRRFQAGIDDSVVMMGIRTGFGGAVKIDTGLVVLHGTSSGGGFIDYLLQKYRIRWGGGFFIQCGIHNYMNDSLPARDWAQDFRVFVATTPDDFLFNHYYPILDHVRHWGGYQVRTSTAGGGGHCTSTEGVKDTAFDWLFQKIDLDTGHMVPGFRPHFEPTAGILSIKSLAATPSGHILAATSVSNKSVIWRSTDGGYSWTSWWSKSDSSNYRVGGVANVGEIAFFSHLRTVYRQLPGGSTSVLRTTGTPSAKLYSDAGQRLWLLDTVWQYSKDSGRTWRKAPSDWTLPDQFATGALAGISTAPPHFIRTTADSNPRILIPDLDLLVADSIAAPSGTRILTSARKGDTVAACVLSGSTQQLYMKTSRSAAWTKMAWPTAEGTTAVSSASTVHQLGFWPDGRLIFMGRPSYVLETSGTWSRLEGAWPAAVEPTAFTSSTSLAKTLFNGYGLATWITSPTTPKKILMTPPSTTEVRVPAAATASPVRRVGSYLQIPSEGGPWLVRWIDASGRVRSETTRSSAGLLPIRPAGSTDVALWVDVEGAGSRTILPVAR